MSQSPQRANNVVILSQTAVAPDSLREDARPLAAEAPAEGETVGARLAAARSAKGLTLEEVWAGTKVKVAHLQAIEAGDKAGLPATPFTAGFIKAYAQFLGLNSEDFARAYRAETGALAAPAEEAAAAIIAPTPAAASPGPERLVAYVGIAATLVSVLWIAVLAISPHKEIAAPVETKAPAAQSTILVEASEEARSEAAAPAAAPEAAIPEVAEQPSPTAPAAAADAGDNTPLMEIYAPAPALQAPSTEIAPQAPSTEITLSAPPQKTPPAPEPRRTAAAEIPAPAIAEPPPAETIAPPAPAVAEEEPAPVAEEIADAAPVPAAPEIVAAQMTRSAAPKYPESCARRAAAVESVMVALDITVDGRPSNARIVETSNDCFDDAALATARRMRFSPRLVDGAPAMESEKIVTVRFAR
jgi:cytoskeleton protein RodZ